MTRGWAAAVAAAGTISLAAIPPSAGAASPAAAASAADGDALAAAIAPAWVPRQRANGTFRDYVVARRPGARDGYGTAMLGAALLLHGLRTGDDRALRSGLRALGRRRPPARRRGSVFSDLAVAIGYAAARTRLRGDRRFRAIRPALVAELRRIDPGVLANRRPYYNFHLVEAAAVLVAQATGLRGGDGALGSGRTRAGSLARSILARILPSIARRDVTTSPVAGTMALISDPPSDPPAYHAFTLGLLSRAIEALGTQAPPATVALRDRAARATWALMAPDGDVAYLGRSQEQSWTLTFSAYGLTAAAGAPGVAPAQAARVLGAADRAPRGCGRSTPTTAWAPGSRPSCATTSARASAAWTATRMRPSTPVPRCSASSSRPAPARRSAAPGPRSRACPRGRSGPTGRASCGSAAARAAS